MKYSAANFRIYATKGPVIVMNQLKSVYNSPFKDPGSHPIHTHFAMISSNEGIRKGEEGEECVIKTHNIRR